MDEQIIGISELNEYVRVRVAGDPFLNRITVRGELSGFKPQSNGTVYFTMKDDNARVECLMWRSDIMRLDFRPEDGMKVLASGKCTFYAPTGKFEINVTQMRKEGLGDLYLRFEKLKQKLMREGLFDASLKKPLPLLPRRIGLVTSRTGAAVRDMYRVLRARMPGADIVLCPVSVQGISAANEIAEGIDLMDRYGNVDVMLVGRGGGSIEDLWAFNEEIVARAIARCNTPVISCVGHEVDFTIADYVADYRAATPSNAAEIAVPVYDEMFRRLDNLENRVKRAILNGQKLRRARLEALTATPYLSAPREMWIVRGRNKLEKLVDRQSSAWERAQVKRRSALDLQIRALKAIDPERVIDRGYAYVTRDDAVIEDAAMLKSGEAVKVHMRDRTVETQVLKTEDK